MKPISTGSPARSIGIPSSATTTRHCPTISMTRNTFQSRTRESSLSAGFWSWILLASSYASITTKYATSSAGKGAYRRYRDLLARRGAHVRWYDFLNKSEEAALREWCLENGIDLSGT